MKAKLDEKVKAAKQRILLKSQENLQLKAMLDDKNLTLFKTSVSENLDL